MELTAVVWGCKQFRQYMWGQKFTIVTDHKLLIWIFKMIGPSSQIMMLKLKLQELYYTIVYEKGKENRNSGGLSGMFSETEPEGAVVNALTEEAEEVGMILDSKESGDTEGKRRGEDESETACTDLSDKVKLETLKEIHDSNIHGHAGINQENGKLKHYINWQGVKSDLEKYIRKCKKCQTNKMTQCHTRMPLMITDTSSIILEVCSIIIIGPFCTSSSQHQYVLKVQDDLSKFMRAVPLEDQTAEHVDHIVLIYGIPQGILSKCGSQFLSETFKSVCKLLGIKRIQSANFWPQSNGLNKCLHKGLIKYLRNYFAADLSNWDQWMKYAVSYCE
jgi:hypothetical protein